MSIVQPFTVALYESQVTRYCHLSAAVAVGYDYLLTVKFEWEYFWKKKWSLGKMLFLFSRYFGLSFCIFNAWSFLRPHPTLEFCLWYFEVESIGTLVQILTTHFILELRLYAMYRRSKRLALFFVFLTLVEITVTMVLFHVPMPDEIRTNEPVTGVFICADADPPNVHFIAWFLAQAALIEAILLGFALYNALYYYARGIGGLTEVLKRDSVMYFAFVFTLYLADTIVWFINDVTMNESLMGFFFGLSFVFANRLMINIRIVYYSKRGTTEKSTREETSMSASVPVFGVPTIEQSDDEDFEIIGRSGTDTIRHRSSYRGSGDDSADTRTIDDELRTTFSEDHGY